MRLAIVTPHPPGTGTLNEYAFHLVRCLRQKPEVQEVILLVDQLPAGQAYTDEPAAPGRAALRFVPCWRFGALSNPLRIARTVRAVRPDVLLFNIQFASFASSKPAAALGLLAPALARLAGTPTIVLLHNLMETVDLKSAGFGGNRLSEWCIRAFGRIITRLLLQADLVALTIPKYVELIEAQYGAKNVVLAPHGSFEELPPPAFDQHAGPLQIMAFGKFGTYKRIEVLIAAYRLLLASGRTALELVIAGTDSPNTPGYLERCRQDAADLPNLRFTGYVPEAEVARVFTEAAIVVFPYTSTTGSSGVLHQAGNYGRAAVLPQLGDLAELVQEEGYTGEFFEPTDPASLAEVIAKLLDDPERRRAIGAQNYAAACGLSMSDVVDWYLLHAQHTVRRSLPVAHAAAAHKG